MNSILLYILKSTICISALYLIFRLIMRKESSFTISRAILLTIVAVSVIIPLLQMPQLIQTPIEVKLIPDFSENTIQIQNQPITESTEPINFQLPDDTPPEQNKLTIPLETLLLYIYLAGVFISFVVLIRNIVIVLKLFSKATVIQKDGYRLLIVDREVPSFAFSRSVVISKSDFDSHGQAIMTHEQAHIRLKHFNDLIFLEAVKIFHWFNLFIYWLIRDLKDIHEFQADDQTLTKGIDATKYQLLIIQKGVGPKRFALANSFNHCQIKKRIVMMNKLKTSKAWRWKVAIFLPMLALLLMAFGKKGENVLPEKETLPSVVSLPQDPVKQWTEADFQELTNQNMRALFDKAKENSQLNVINIHIDQKSSITVNTDFNVWKAMNLDEIHSLIERSWTYNEKRKKIIPIPLVLISKDSTTLQSDYLKLLNVAANSILRVRDNFSKKLYDLSYPKLTTVQHNEIDQLIPMNVVYSIGKLEKVPPPPPLTNQKGQKNQANILKEIPPPPPIPRIFIEIKKEGIYLMKKLVTLDEFRKQLPEVVKKNPQSEAVISSDDKNNSNIKAVENILQEEGVSIVKYRNTIKFTPPETSDLRFPKRNTFSIQVDAKGKVFVGFDGQDNRQKLLTRMGKDYNIVFSPKELEEFSKINSFGVTMNRMKAFLKMSAAERDKAENAIGIPYSSGNNEFKNWVRTARTVNKDMHITIKSDQAASYRVIDQLIETLRDLNENRYYLALPEWTTAYEIAMPSKEKPAGEQAGAVKKFTQSSVLDYVKDKPRVVTIIPDKDNSVYYYLGTQDAKGNNPVLTKTDFSPSGIHELLISMNHDVFAKVEALKKKKENGELSAEDFEKQRVAILSDKTAPIVLIKPTDASNYGNFMNILDEMNVCGIGRYAIIDLTDYDKNLISKAR